MQHPSGVVVGHIAVRERSLVKQGDVVIRLDDTVPRSTLGVVRAQLDEALVRKARLLAERDGTETVTFPGEQQCCVLKARASRRLCNPWGQKIKQGFD